MREESRSFEPLAGTDEQEAGMVSVEHVRKLVGRLMRGSLPEIIRGHQRQQRDGLAAGIEADERVEFACDQTVRELGRGLRLGDRYFRIVARVSLPGAGAVR